jgi:hypothetical protein
MATHPPIWARCSLFGENMLAVRDLPRAQGGRRTPYQTIVVSGCSGGRDTFGVQSVPTPFCNQQAGVGWVGLDLLP